MKKWLSELLKTYFFQYFPWIVIFTASLYNPADSDLGWHLKYGEYFFKTGTILRENIFSTMMAGYKWVNSSWAIDLITYLTYQSFGFLGLSILGALVVTATFYFFSKAAKLTFWEQAFILIILYYVEPLTVVSFRGHLLTLLALGVLYYFLRLYEDGKRKVILFSPALFILWSNLHGEFILGLGMFGVWIALFFVSQSLQFGWGKIKSIIREHKILPLAFFLSALVTLVNPFGIGVYQESFRHFGNPMQKFIIEWLAFDTYSSLWWNLVVWGVVIAINIVVIIKKKEFRKYFPYIGIVSLLYFFSYWMRRYAWPMYLVSIPVVANVFRLLKPKNVVLGAIIPTLLLVSFYFYVIVFKNPGYHLRIMSWDFYCSSYVGCSPKSAEFLRKQKNLGKLFTFYNWGGWLIWNYYPDIVPSIDGRMHLWVDEHGYSAFAEYYPYEQDFANIDETDYDVVYMTPTKPLFHQMMRLVKEEKWTVSYQDNFAAVFVRNKKS